MNTINICISNDDDCFANSLKYINGNSLSYPDKLAFVLADGQAVIVIPFSTYYAMYIDINGKKKPNQFGKDIFRMDYNYRNSEIFLNVVGTGLERDEILNGDSVNPTYGCNRNGVGLYCGGLIIYDGWQIKDDYPW